jgi:hypothetical protein
LLDNLPSIRHRLPPTAGHVPQALASIMARVSARPTALHPADAKLLRISLTYVLPALAVSYVILSALWLVPDSFAGMYGNHDGHWASWGVRGIWQWSAALDFSPFSPLVGTGSLFAPNLPWLNPGALALAIPAPLPVRHLVSMLVYLTELVASLYLLYRHLEFSREQSFLATLLYVCLFFIPFWGVMQTLPWYSLAPMNAHLIAAMNVATIALIRLSYEGFISRLLFSLVFLAALFVAFASAPVSSLTYAPAYAVLWITFVVPFRTRRRAVLWRCGAIAFAVIVLGAIGVLRYLAATVMMSARGDMSPPIFHPRWRLLSPTYWQDLAASLPVCSSQMQLMCPSAIIGWFEVAVLAGAVVLSLTASGAKRRYGLVIIILLVSIHLYALLSMQQVLGRLHTVSTPYLMWSFFPLAAPAAISAATSVATWVIGRRAASSAWLPAAGSCLVAIAAIAVWVRMIEPSLPRPPGRGLLVGRAPIAHTPVKRGPIIDYLQQHIGLAPGAEFRGYAATFLGAPDGLVRKATGAASERMTYEVYLAARDILFDRFGNSFQMMDLWNNDIPTLEEYGQWVSRQMYYFTRDLLAQKQDHVDPLQSSILLYRFQPLLLRALGVRFVIADGTLADPGLEPVMTETGKAGATINLHEIKGANLGQFSPTEAISAGDYVTAVAALREQRDFENRVVVSFGKADLVRASHSRLVAIKDGYRLTASAPGTALLVLPVQFSHCWDIEDSSNRPPPSLLRANIVQTGILFKNNVDVRLRFNFEPWSASCRLEDARDLTRFGFK